MSLDRCITSLKDAGLLDEERAAYFAEQFEDLRTEYRKVMADAAADAAATRDVVTNAERLITISTQQKLLALKNKQGIIQTVRDYQAKGVSPARTLLSMFGSREGMLSIKNLEGHHLAIRGQMHALIEEGLRKFNKDLLGRQRNAADLENVGREAFGENTGDVSAKEIAQAVADAREFGRRRLVAAGAPVGKKDRYGLPQRHMSDKVMGVPYAEWRAVVIDTIDPARMTDSTTGKPFTARALERALQNAYASIRSEGFDDLTPGAAGKMKLANRWGAHRFLEFKDFDAWKRYHDRFGPDNMWDMIVGQFDSMARDIALLEMFGPNPTNTLQWMKDIIEQDVRTSGASGKLFGNQISEVNRAQLRMDQMFKSFTGESNAPINVNIAKGFAANRDIQTSAKLGSAMLTALTDPAYQFSTARMNGLSTARIMRNYIKLLNPLDEGDRQLAVASGLIAEESASRMGAIWRYDQTINGPEITKRIASGVLRLSGLSAWTQAGKHAFGLEVMHVFAREAATAWEALPKRNRRFLERYGWDVASWDQLRSTPLHDERGGKFLQIVDVKDQAIRDRYAAMILQEEKLALPQTTLRARSRVDSIGTRGTVSGETIRSVWQFKSFPISIMMTHGARIVVEKNIGSAAAMTVNLMLSTMVLGALATQLSEVAKGRDPRKMFDDGKPDAKFWANALLKGGGLGLAGDFLYADTSRYGGSATALALGPTVGTAFDLTDLTVGNLRQAQNDEKTNFGRELVRFAKANTPGSSLWYTRLAFERIFWDQVQQELDPEAHRAWGRMERKMRAEYDQEFYWAPGDTKAERAPDFEAIDGGSQ